jgi:hypothetical protein
MKNSNKVAQPDKVPLAVNATFEELVKISVTKAQKPEHIKKAAVKKAAKKKL